MDFRKLFAAAVVVIVSLLVMVLWLWSSRRPAAEGPISATQPTRITSGSAPQAKLKETPLTPIQLSPERMQSIGVTFGTVQMGTLSGDIRATGNVDVDERRVAYVQTRFSGWLRHVYVNATYQYVRKGQPLFTIYSPDLVATEQEYLLARKDQQQLQGSTVSGVAEGASSLVSAARDRLRQWQVTDSEIAKLDATGKAITELTVYSPVTGYVTERAALPNMYVQPDTRLYTVTDLSSVWVNAQVFQNDIGNVKPGEPAKVTVDSYPGRTFRGRVDQVLPQVDMNTRTVSVRLVLANPGLVLKPGMYVNVDLQTAMGKSLIVPASAVLQSGARQIVFIDGGNGKLEPVQVVLGQRYGESFVVLKGLKNGDRVATSANFLLDSESQLQDAAGAFTPPPPGAGGAAAMNQGAMDQTSQQAEAELSSDPDPPHTGANTFRVKLTTLDGEPISGAQVTVTFFMPAMSAMGMAEMKVPVSLEDKGNGTYEGRGELGSGGTWQVTIVARQNGQVLVDRQMTMSATGGM